MKSPFALSLLGLVFLGICCPGWSAELDSAVLDLFEKRCSECHAPDKDEKPALGKGVSLAELRSDTTVVKAGDPENSELLRRVLLPEDNRGRMPKSGRRGDSKYRAPLTAGEVDLIRKWIQGTEGGGRRAFVAETNLLDRIIRDLRAIPESSRGEYRYLSLHNLHNLPPQIEEDRNLAIYRAGVSKLINSLSWEPKVVPLVSVGDDGVLLRLRLPDYGWTPATWDMVVRHNPYGLPHGDRDRVARELSGTGQVWVRADWFAFAVAQPPLYEQVLFAAKIPRMLSDVEHAERHLESYLGIDPQARLQAASQRARGRLRGIAFGDGAATSDDVLRAGIKSGASGVSLANRLIERFARPGGLAYWRSYDFSHATGLEVQDLFQRPLGPMGSKLSQNDRFAFQHDGGELIFHLPNGLQGYLLTTQSGKSLRRAPAEIVQDRTRRDGQILNGISCMKCHDQGLKDPPAGVRDDVGDAVIQALGAAMTPDERRAVQSLYATTERLAPVFRRDRQPFQKALRELGADAFAEEPIGFLYYSFIRGITEPMLVAELDINPAALRQPLREVLLQSASTLVRSRVAQLNDGLSRRDFIPVFQEIASELMGLETRPFQALDYTEFTLQSVSASASSPTASTTIPVVSGLVGAVRDPKQASRGAPWENSLGMKFVPVPGTPVLFSVWETRVQDFEAFVNETGHDATAGMFSLGSDEWKQRGQSWRSPGFAQTRTHPVVGVSWEDARAFCAWLSRKEGRVYRLPTDLEWSAAVGLSGESGATPKDRDEKIPGVYPWEPASQFPPPGDAGNYAGAEARDTQWPPSYSTIDGFRDAFPRTAPVGSFKVNRYGLFDLGGNVWEWCEDLYEPGQTFRVLRGGSWYDGLIPRYLLSSSRVIGLPVYRRTICGFRVVVVVESR